MKTAKRVLAILVALIMVVGTCAVAASAAYTTGTEDGKTKITLTSNTTKTFTISEDTVIDLNGYRLTGEDGKAAIKITAGDVTVTNGQVEAFFGKMSTMDMIKNVNDHCPPAISISGGSLTVDGCRIVGGTIRVPTTPIDDPILVPAGSGIMSYNGATVTLKRTSIFGDYGVNNAVRSSTPGGVVTVEDAIILAYNTAIKGQYDVAEGSEEIIAADRIEGVLNNGIHLTDSEKEIIANGLNDRTLIVSKTAEELTTILDKTTPLVTKYADQSIAEINAEILDYSWKNDKGTDCSYRLVPEAIKLTDGTYAALDNAEKDDIDATSKIRYRVQFLIGTEAYPYIESLTKEGLDNPLDGVLGWAGEELNSYYAQYTGTTNNGKVDTYDEIIAMLGDVLTTIDELGGQPFPGQDNVPAEDKVYIQEMDLYKQLQQKLYRLAGETGFNAKFPNGDYSFTSDTWRNIFGAEAGAKPAYPNVGTLDKIQKLKDDMEAILGDNLFKNTDAYDELAGWAIDTAYPQLLEILDEFIERVQDLLDFLDDPDMAKIVDMANIDSQLKLLKDGLRYAKRARQEYNKAMNNADVSSTISYLQDNRTTIMGHVAKAVEVIENWRTYITPEKFIVNSEVTGKMQYVKTYSTLGPIEINEVIPEGNLHITVGAGKGTVNYSTDVLTGSVTDQALEGVRVPFETTFTLTAEPKTNYEFLFWVNTEGGGNGRILSTETSFRMNTTLDRDITAVFARINAPVAYFTNPTGDIVANVELVDGKIPASDIGAPYIAGYGFAGWPAVADDQIDPTTMDNTAYAMGGSVFANPNTYYGPDGAVLLVRPECSSYIVTPKFSKNGIYTVTFIDGDNTFSAEGKYSDIATCSASYGDYWVIDGTDTVACVNATYPYQIIDNATFKSVSGSPANDTYTRTTTRVENGYVVFYIERTTSKQIKTTGYIYSISNSNPTYGGEKCYIATAKFTNQTGLYAPSVKLSDLGNRTWYCRPYIEFADGTFYEDPVVTVYPAP